MTTAKHSESRPTPKRPMRAGGVTRPAFTVIELLVAIGAVAIVSIGLAAIFDAIGKTVQGGRRVSVLTQYAAMIENQLRHDIESIDPNSFLMIRQQFVDVGNDGVIDASDTVQLFPNQTANLRPRRIDEMVFFARGDFTSMRSPIGLDRPTKSRQARVYYGHGEKMLFPITATGAAYDDYASPTFDFRIRPGNENAATLAMPRLGIASGVGNPSPVSSINQYASEWTLLRHQTLLVPPTMTEVSPGNLATLGIAPPARAFDGDSQIDLQPAAASIFRTVNFRVPTQFRASSYAWIDSANNEIRPNFATGMVDVATTDLDEIRSQILSITMLPVDAANYPGELANIKAFNFAEHLTGVRPGVAADSFDSLERMQAWMSDAFPTQSLSVAPPPAGFTAPFLYDPRGGRIRYETQPVGMREVLEATGADPLQEAYRRANQIMLTAHNFVPRCSEFIVEWSFGRTNPVTRALIWHGPPRPGISPEELCFYPYYIGADPLQPLAEGTSFEFICPDPANPGAMLPIRDEVFTVTDRLIYGESPNRVATPSVVTSYFGYTDPTFNPVHPLLDNPATPEDESLGSSVTGELIQWPRPKLIRVTISIADPQDPSKEETFQFVFDVPQTRAR